MIRLLAALLVAAALFGTGQARPRKKIQPGPAQHNIVQTILRVGDHGSFGRVAFMLPPGTSADAISESRLGDRLTVQIPGAGLIVAAAPGADVTRHVRSVATGIGQAVLTLDPGSVTRIWHDKSRLIVDVFAAASVPEAAVPAPPQPGLSASGLPPSSAPPSSAPPSSPRVTQPASAQDGAIRAAAVAASDAAQAADQAPVPDDTATAAAAPSAGDDALMATRVPGPGDAILLPLGAQTGAAAFTRNGQAIVVFDESKAVDMAALKGDPVFGAARITLLPASTELSMPAPPSRFMALRRQKSGWVVALQHGRGPGEAADIKFAGGVLSVAMPHPAASVVVIDALTGSKLLVGTVRDHGPAILVPHASPDFTLLPSWEGVVVLPGSDRVALRAVRAGFTLQAATGPPLSAILDRASQTALALSGALTRRFDIPPMPVRDLLLRLDGDVGAASSTPKQGRFAARLRAAQDMLGLGMDHEALALLEAARADDPSQQARPDALALEAMAAFLEGGTDPAALAAIGTPLLAALDSPALGDADEVALWRAMLPSHAAPAAERAAIVAADWRLLLSYPEPLRRRLLPLAAALLVDGHQAEAAGALLAACGDAALDSARARLLRMQGKTDASLAMLDQVAAGHDRKAQALARRAAIDVRLASGKITPAKAAASLLAQIDDWREPDVEIPTRLKAAKLLVQAGEFRRALATLRETEKLFPAAHDSVHDSERHAVLGLAQGGAAAKLSPLDLVALVEENSDLLAADDVASSLTPVLVDKLVALDLPERAGKLVAGLMAATNDAGAKATLGDRLAGLRLDQRDATGALAALDQSDAQSGAADLPADLVSARGVKRARAFVLIGRDDEALRALAPLSDGDALNLQASLLEKTHDWRDAEAALLKLVRSEIPASAVLSDAQQDLVLRFAGAASQAGDEAALRVLQNGLAHSLTPGPRAALFATLAAQPVQSVGDLPRSGREADAARALPAALTQYGGH